MYIFRVFLFFIGEDRVESTHGLLTTVAFQKEQQLFLISFFFEEKYNEIK
jgi:hypothetical protein